VDFKGSHILSVEQFELGDVESLFAVARRMEVYARRQRVTRVLEGAVLGNLFFEPSTRSRISFGAAFNRLGGAVRDTAGFDVSSIVKGESIYDTSRVISGYVDVLVIRHPREGAVREFAQATNLPVINAGDGPGEHPTQALLDLYTIQRELKKEDLRGLRGLRVAMLGDLKFGRTVHSLTKLLSLLDDVEFRLVSPEELRMPEKVTELARRRGHRVRQTPELADGLAGADVVYVTRVQEERFTDRGTYERFRGAYSINLATVRGLCKPDVVLMHPLPRDSRLGSHELVDDLNRLPNLAIFRQSDNGIPVRMALFALVLGVADRAEQAAREVTWFVPATIGRYDA
jgi:aspartate carbamoyltransferase catalytic subunit